MNPNSPYEILAKLGEGAYGTVLKARHKATDQIVAIKGIKISSDDEGISSTTLRQMTVLKNIQHPNIIKLLDLKIHINCLDPRIELIFEYMNEDLSKLIRRMKKIDPSLVKDILYQILIGVEYLHNKKVFHRDLKPHNILFDGNNRIKIADFGLARIIGKHFETMSREIETLWYRAPELLLGTANYDFSVDMWSVGCIFYEIAEGRVLFQAESEIGQIFKIFEECGTPKMAQWNEVTGLPYFKGTFPKFNSTGRNYLNLGCDGIDLLEKMIRLNPSTRITVSEALKHPYFQ